MIQPLALVFYEKLLPGTQIVNRLQDLNYRVQAVGDAAKLVECARQAKPMLVIADLHSGRSDLCAAITELRKNPATQHLPVIVFGDRTGAAAAADAGASLVVSEAAILNHLQQCLERALQVD